MSSLSDAIQYTQQGINNCEELAGMLARGGELLSELEGMLSAGLADTPNFQTTMQYHQVINSEVISAAQTTQQLKQELEGILARFQAAGGY